MQQYIDNVYSEYNISPSLSQSDGIAILVDLAKSGKIDPWNIDIVDVYDKYMLKLIEMKANNLKTTGRMLVLASILIRLKSNALEGISLNDFEPQPEEYFDDYEDYDTFEEPVQMQMQNNTISFEEALKRRTSVRMNSKRNVTLEDLIRHLEFYEQLERKRSLKNAHERAKRRVQNYAKFTPQDIVNLAHEEYIEKTVEKIEAGLRKIFDTEEKVELKEITALGIDKLSAYIALLFLASRSDYELVQKEFYSDLYVIKTQKTGEAS